MPYKDIEKRKECAKNYCRSRKYKFYDWKRKGIKFDDEDDTWIKWTTTSQCELCDVTFEKDNKKSKPNVDHDHMSGYFRWIVCPKCNSTLKIIDQQKLLVLLELHRYFKTSLIF